MATADRCVTIHPYFVIKEGELESVRSYLEKFVELTRSEQDCLYYGFTLCGNKLYCREGYANGAGALAHHRHAVEGDPAPAGHGTISIARGIEVG